MTRKIRRLKRVAPLSPRLQVMVFGGIYRPEVCRACSLFETHLCTRQGCEVTAQQAIVDLNGGRPSALPKVPNPRQPTEAERAAWWALHGGAPQ